jgi:hypothetical protein
MSEFQDKRDDEEEVEGHKKGFLPEDEDEDPEVEGHAKRW